MNIKKNNNPVKHRKIVKRRTKSSMHTLTYIGGNSESFPPRSHHWDPQEITNEKHCTMSLCLEAAGFLTFRSPHFTKSFLARLPTRSGLLFSFKIWGKWQFFSPPKPQNVDETKSVVTAEYHMGFSGDWYKEVC